MTDSDKYCIIMAGGIGSRFWPLSRNATPKQFLDILGTGRSFLQETCSRFEQIIPVENIIIVTAERYKDLVKSQVPQIMEENILLEPHRRNTAPCIAYATYKLFKKNPNATIVVSPSDHLITNENIFLETIVRAMNYAANHDVLFTLGIKPTRPETAYGYIQTNKAEKINIEGYEAFGVKTFTEKPDADLAKVFVDSGEFLWNSGIFIWNIRTIMNELESYLPEIANSFKDGTDFYYTDEESRYIKGIYEACNGISIDYGVMERTGKSLVMEATFGWSDLGTWHSLYVQSHKDEKDNVIMAEPALIDETESSIILTTNKEKLMVVKELDGYMVIDTPDVLLICRRNETSFKDAVTDLAVHELNKYQ